LRQVLTDVANELRDNGALDEEECFIERRWVDRHGSPLSVSTHAANHHEVRLVQLCFDFEAKPVNLIGARPNQMCEKL
jgi:hypothetical protein